jgi:hypothetical protein
MILRALARQWERKISTRMGVRQISLRQPEQHTVSMGASQT